MEAWRRQTKDRYFLSPENFEKADWRSLWSRNYFGFTRKGHRFLYIDFAPRRYRDGFGMCDGGPAYFGIEIDAGSGSILDLQANGMG